MVINMKTIGIIGGMGPAASADLFLKILALEDAESDQAHLPVLIDSNTRIPDRTAAIVQGGESPVPELLRSALRLQGMGADLLMMACNTAHYFYEEIAARVKIPLLHMPRQCARELAEAGCRKAALLATSGTVRAGVYADAFAREAPDVELLTPDEEGQRALMGLIYDGVKKGRTDYPTQAVRACLEKLTARGAESFILGCTELPIAFSQTDFGVPTADPTVLVARAAIRAAGGRLRAQAE